jgi:hypothetical protein
MANSFLNLFLWFFSFFSKGGGKNRREFEAGIGQPLGDATQFTG